MEGSRKEAGERAGDGRKWFFGVVVAMVAVIFLAVIGCREGASPPAAIAPERETLQVGEYTVPVFSTARQQLNYTRSWFADRDEKLAALHAFLRLYPGQCRYCGAAALDLAYFQLGHDYRFASSQQKIAAIHAYEDITLKYANVPQVRVKALWYLGWIHGDLLGELEKAKQYYLQVVEEYPRQNVSLIPPAPWVSLIYQQESTESFSREPESQNTWAALALVEAIRLSNDRQQAWNHFLRLWQDYRRDVACGFGLRLVLHRRYHPDEVVGMASEYLDSQLSNVHILRDIRQQLLVLKGLKEKPE